MCVYVFWCFGVFDVLRFGHFSIPRVGGPKHENTKTLKHINALTLANQICSVITPKVFQIAIPNRTTTCTVQSNQTD